MIMFFQMFKIQCIYIAVWEEKLCYYVITNRLFYSILQKTTLKDVILELSTTWLIY